MTEQTRRRTRPAAPVGGIDALDPLASPAAQDRTRNATLQSSFFAGPLPIAGMTVGEVRRRFAVSHFIEPGSDVVIDREPAGEDTVIRAGQIVTFVRYSGVKGKRW